MLPRPKSRDFRLVGGEGGFGEREFGTIVTFRNNTVVNNHNNNNNNVDLITLSINTRRVAPFRSVHCFRLDANSRTKKERMERVLRNCSVTAFGTKNAGARALSLSRAFCAVVLQFPLVRNLLTSIDGPAAARRDQMPASSTHHYHSSLITHHGIFF